MQQRSVRATGQQNHTHAVVKPAARRASTATPERATPARNADPQSLHFGHDLSDVRVYPDTSALSRMRPASISYDLSKPGDNSEREADRAADEVMSGETALPEITAQPARINRMLASPEAEGLLSNSWLGQKVSEAGAGIGGALSGAEGWLGGKAGEAIGGATGAAQSGLGWLGNTANQAMSGDISPSWLMGKAGEAMGGLSGAAMDATSWFGGTQMQAANGIAQAGGQATNWMTNTAGQANGIASDAASQAVSPVLSLLQDHPDSVLM